MALSSRLVIVVLGGVVTATAVMVGFQRSGAEDRQAAELVRIADRVLAPPSWTLVESLTRQAGALCVDVECPSVSRRWTSAAAVTPVQLIALLEHAGLADVSVQGDCRPQDGRTGAVPLCQAWSGGPVARAVLTLSGQATAGSPEYGVTLLVTVAD